MKNGYNLKLTMDAKEFDESIVYSGKGSKENNFLAQKALSDENFEKELEDLLQKDEATFKSALDKKSNNDLSKLEVNQFRNYKKEKIEQSVDRKRKFNVIV